MLRELRAASVLAVAVVALSGCVFVPGLVGGSDAPVDPPAATEPPEATDPPAASGPETTEPETSAPETDADTACEVGDYECALQERDRFMEEQQLPTDGTPLVAVTPEQQEFIGNQRAHVESQGGTWTAQDESIVLALTADACESAILNFHQMNETLFTTHVATSPLFQQLVPADGSEAEREQAEASLADIMVYGMQFMCPDDFPAWATVFGEMYPNY